MEDPTAMPKSQPRASASKRAGASDPSKGGRWLAPKILLTALGIVAAAAIGLGAVLALGLTSDSAQPLTVVSCKSGTPGCLLREPIHEHANFALVVRGTAYNFNQSQFLSSEGNEKSALAHLHEPRFGVAHIHRSGTNWDEFFRTIGFELQDPSLPGTTADKTCLKFPDGQRLCTSATESFKFFVNAVRVDGVSATGMHDLDRILISYGSETDETVVQQQLAKTGDDACIPSERCTNRIPKDEPPEQCTKSNDTCVKPGG